MAKQKTENHDKAVNVIISRTVAYEGGMIDIITPSGTVRMRIPPNTVSGTVFRLPGKGEPERPGENARDFYVRISLAKEETKAAGQPQKTKSGIGRNIPLPLKITAASATIAAIFGGALIFGKSNRDGLIYNTWFTVGSLNGIEYEYLRKPNIRGGLFDKEWYGIRELLLRVNHVGDQPRCVRIVSESAPAKASLGKLSQWSLIMPGETLTSSKAEPASDPNFSWQPNLTLQVAEPYREGGQYRCKRTDPCAMTQSICAQTGKSDDCLELTLLRSFRDQILAATPEGQQAIVDYYRDTAVITQSLLSHPDSQLWLKILRENYLLPIGNAFATGQYEEATSHFNNFMALLRKHHLRS